MFFDSVIDVAPEPDPDSAFECPIAQYSIEDSGARYIALLTLRQATTDAESAHDTAVRRAARWYLTNETPDLRFICAIGRINARYVVETWRKRLGFIQPLPEKKKMFDFLKREKRHGRNKNITPGALGFGLGQDAAGADEPGSCLDRNFHREEILPAQSPA